LGIRNPQSLKDRKEIGICPIRAGKNVYLVGAYRLVCLSASLEKAWYNSVYGIV